MNLISRTITGLFMVVLGIILVGVSFFTSFVILIYAAPILIIGIIIFFNKKEDEIERIKVKGGKNE